MALPSVDGRQLKHFLSDHITLGSVENRETGQAL
jgi:hypothetical protein